MTKSWWESLDSRTRALGGAALALLLVAFGLGLAFDNPDSGSGNGSWLDSAVFRVKSVFRASPVVERPTMWSTPSDSAWSSFLSTLAADPTAPKALAALSADGFLVEQWGQFQRTHDSAAFVDALQGHREFQQVLAGLASDPEFSGLKRRALSHPLGQALAPRFAMFSSGRPGASAEAGNRLRGDAVETGGLGPGASGAPAPVTGVVDPGAGELAPPGPGRIDSQFSGPSSGGDIKVPAPGEGAN